MTFVKDVFGRDLFKDMFGKDYDRFYVGFNDHVTKMAELHKEVAKNIPAYPPYNIKKSGDNTYQIELAVAGFGKQDIEVELADNKLVIRGNSSAETPAEENFLVKGIGMRSFTRTFAIDDHIEVQNAELINGMLKIVLEKLVPEEKKPKKIKVKSRDNTDPVEL